MRVLISTGIFPNPADPTRGIYIYKQAEALLRRGSVEAIVPVAQYPPGMARRAADIPAETEIDGLRVFHPRYRIVPGLRMLHGPAVVRSTLELHQRVVAELKPDAILSFFAYPYGFAATRIGERLGLPVIVGTLGSDLNVKARRPVEGPMIRRALKRAARVISVSHDLDRQVAALGVAARRRAVIPNGIDGHRFVPMDRAEARAKLGMGAGERVICCVSRLSREKGIDILVRAAAEMTTPARVVVVGDGVERASLQRLVSDLGLRDRVVFAGAMPHAEVPVWIAAGDVSALPSRMEGHPNAVLEAMACGRPVVGTRVGGVPEALHSEELGRLVDPEDPSGLARALDSALATEWNTDVIARAGGARTWDDVAAELVEVIHAVRSETR
jgi:glycosyltransferase involved in cell wall biosynthesis